MQSEAASLASLLKRLENDPVRFNKHVLGRVHATLPDGYWDKQKDVCEAFYKFKQVNVQSGHGTGKTFLASGIGVQYLTTHPNSVVICYAPSSQQLLNGLWPEIKKAYLGSRLKLPGRIINGANPKIELGPKWYLQCRSADTDPERLQGVHASKFAVICDEASWPGYDQALEAIESQNPERLLLLGNPLRLGKFSDYCSKADGITSKTLAISSLESPHIGMDRSPVGLADKGWLDSVRLNYGEGGLYWRVRVEGNWPDEDSHHLIPSSWLDRCTKPHVCFSDPCNGCPACKRGSIWISVDLSAGTGQGDLSVILVRDENGILEMDWSASWKFPEGAAERVKFFATKYKVPPSRIVYDQSGLGAGFDYALKQQGLSDCRGYVGGARGGKWASNFRSASALAMRDRLDPSRNEIPFHIPEKYMNTLRPELTGLRYELVGQDVVKLENKEDYKKRLGRSPDRLDSFIMSFAY